MPESRTEQALTRLSLGVLMTVAGEPQHGYAILTALEARGGPRLVAGAGSLYAALDRLVEEGLLKTQPDAADPRRKRRFAITGAGRKAVRAELARMAAVVEEGRAKDLLPERA